MDKTGNVFEPIPLISPGKHKQYEKQVGVCVSGFSYPWLGRVDRRGGPTISLNQEKQTRQKCSFLSARKDGKSNKQNRLGVSILP